ncbi:MAG: P-loop NTPase, partial [Isosphaeraceae bacterium]
MSDQADKLRQLVGASRAATALAEDEPDPVANAAGSARTTRSLLFTSGKGGVGTSNLVLNLAIALGELGQRVLVVDADLGLANLD